MQKKNNLKENYFMFFTLHPERKIGYKKLSEADLGLSLDSHQTHIGLYERKNMLSLFFKGFSM